MKHISFLILLTLVLVSCGTDSHHFEIEGRLTNLNQGEFYVYSPDGGLSGIDTIKVEGGRFSYEIPCENECVLVVVFPNFSEQAIFAKPGKSVDVKGDASHLKELEVTGTDDNELMTKFRHQISNASPPEISKYASMFIEDHPASPVGAFIVSQYILKSQQPDYKKAMKLLDMMHNQQPRNGYVNHLIAQVKTICDAQSGNSITDFTAYDINGKAVSSSTLKSSPVALVYTWATWSFESTDLQRRLKAMHDKAAGKLQIVSICLDASKADCKRNISQDQINWPIICDEQMFDGPIVKRLGLLAVPDNILMQNGRIIARGLSVNDLTQRLEKII
jgi:hypothetical protein